MLCKNSTHTIHALWMLIGQVILMIGLHDEGTTIKWNVDPIQVPIGLIIRVQAKKFKETFNGLIHNIWAEVNS